MITDVFAKWLRQMAIELSSTSHEKYRATNEQSKPLLFGTNYNFPFTALEREIEASVESERFDGIEDLIPSTIYQTPSILNSLPKAHMDP